MEHQKTRNWGVSDPIRNVRLQNIKDDIGELFETGNLRGRVVPSLGTQINACDATTGWTASANATATAIDTNRKTEGTGALKMGSTDGGTHTYTLAFGPTDMTGVKKLFLDFWRPLNLTSHTTAIAIRIGTDASNFYEFDLNTANTDLWGAWAKEELDIFNPDSTTGTPTISSMAWLQVEIINTEARPAGDYLIDDIRWAKLAVDIKPFVARVGSTTVEVSATTLVLTASGTNRYIQVNTVGTISDDATQDTEKLTLAKYSTDTDEITALTILRPDALGGELGGTIIPPSFLGGFVSGSFPGYSDTVGLCPMFTYSSTQIWLATSFRGSEGYTYKNGNNQYILSTTFGASYNKAQGVMVRGGYEYAIVFDTTGGTGKLYRCAVTDDISVVGNWVEITLSGFTITSTSFLAGYGNNYFWMTIGSSQLAYFTLSGTTLTYVGTVTVTGSSTDYSIYSGVNDNGIYAGFSSAPKLRKAAFDGTLDANKQWNENIWGILNNAVYTKTMDSSAQTIGGAIVDY